MNTQDFCFILKQNSHLLREGCFGLEKENVRVNQDGTLALTPHPAVFGDKGKHPYITTDFSESQVEMITPPLPSVGEALGFMETLHDVVTENIGDELLWPQSLPPVLKENQEIIQRELVLEALKYLMIIIWWRLIQSFRIVPSAAIKQEMYSWQQSIRAHQM